MNPKENDPLGNAIRQYRKEGKSWNTIESLLIQTNQWNTEEVLLALGKEKKEYHDKHVKIGKTKIVCGIVLLGLNFVISCINFHANLPFSSIMYGFTTAGIILLLWGTYDCLH